MHCHCEEEFTTLNMNVTSGLVLITFHAANANMIFLFFFLYFNKNCLIVILMKADFHISRPNCCGFALVCLFYFFELEKKHDHMLEAHPIPLFVFSFCHNFN